MKNTMKKLFLLVAMVVLCFTLTISANALDATGQCGDNVYWNFNSETGELIISGEGPMYDVDFLFSETYNIKTVVISQGVTSVSDYAFYWCKGLLTSVTIPDSVTNIGYMAFGECNNLTTIEVDSNNACYSSVDGVLFNKDKTTLIQYPTGDTRTSYIIPDSVTNITDGAFSNCKNLTSITIPYNVTSIGYRTFYCCFNLANITIPDSVTSIGEQAFYHCNSLTSITIPDSVTSIGELAFYHCDSLTSITIPDSVTSIGNDAFDYCKNLTSITIGESVTSIGGGALVECTKLTNIEVDPNNACLSSVDGVLFNKDKSILIQYPSGNTRTSYTIPDGVMSISYNAFSYSENLTSITIPDSVMSIGRYAFSDCSSLESITIGKGVTHIGYDAFDETKSLTNIEVDPSNTCYSDVDGVLFNKDKTTLIQYPIGNTRTSYIIPDGVTSISNNAFSYCENLTSITIPDSVTSIDSYAFGYCYNLGSITIGKGVTDIDSSAFYGTAYYNNSDNWSNGVLYLGHCLLDVDNSNTQIAIPENITTISALAFANSNITEITIHGAVKTIPEYAFSSCSSLKTVTIKEGVQRIDNYAFRSCTNLSEISIPESVESIGESVFENTGYSNNEDNWDGNYLYINNCLVAINSHSYAPEKVYIDENIKVICDSFSSSFIESIEVNENNPYFSSDEYGVLYNKDKTKMLVYPFFSKNTTYVFPDTVKEISVMYSIYLRSIVIPQSVEKITDPTFASFGLKDIYIHNDNIILHKDSMLGYTSVNPEAFEMYFDEYLELWGKAEQGIITEEELIRAEELNVLISGVSEITPYGTIHANAGSTAEAYAKENGINFELLTDDEPQESTTVKDIETNVEIEFDSSAFETEVSLVVSEDAVNADIVFGDEYENYKAFDISIEVNGEKVQPNGKVTVKLPLPEGFDAETTVVYYVDENGNKEEIESTVEDGFVIFETDHFSEYVLVDESTKHEHSYKGTVTKEPTCTEPGVKTYTCSCNDSYTEPVAATGHSHNKVVTAPTCTAKGYTTYTCSCGDSYVADYVNALGHKDTNGDYKCDYNCGYEFQKPAEPEAPSDPSENCSCNCHKGGFMGFIWKIINFFQKLFKANPVCACGAAHY